VRDDLVKDLVEQLGALRAALGEACMLALDRIAKDDDETRARLLELLKQTGVTLEFFYQREN
jgi:hypothetical protein